ncbi:MAG: NUDIX hydrolase [Woeseiaceae bacterium]|nr:NUDIX hydrolase [Woeseiaceae bacterium]
MKPSDIAPARPSSTVVLVRDNDDGPEVFLVRRHKASSYGGAYVFPGGVIDPPDKLITDRCVDISPDAANQRLRLGEEGACYYSAAIRELFEESGVLLADHAMSAAELEKNRIELNAGKIRWDELVVGNKLTLKCSELRYFSHWITPDVYPKRYTTRFFLTAMPEDQYACHDNCELTGEVWISPAAALGAAADGELPLHFPTIKTIEQLAGLDSMSQILDWAADCERAGVEAIHPVMPSGTARGEPGVWRTPRELL